MQRFMLEDKRFMLEAAERRLEVTRWGVKAGHTAPSQVSEREQGIDALKQEIAQMEQQYQA